MPVLANPETPRSVTYIIGLFRKNVRHSEKSLFPSLHEATSCQNKKCAN